MRGEAGNDGGGGDTQVLDGGTPPLGECALFIGRGSVGDWCNVKVLFFFVGGCTLRSSGSPSSDGDGTQREADDWALYDETQPLDDAETQLVDEVVEKEEGVAGDWTETQLVESGDEDGGDDGDQVKTQQEVEDGKGGDVGGGAEDNACNCTKT